MLCLSYVRRDLTFLNRKNCDTCESHSKPPSEVIRREWHAYCFGYRNQVGHCLARLFDSTFMINTMKLYKIQKQHSWRLLCPLKLHYPSKLVIILLMQIGFVGGNRLKKLMELILPKEISNFRPISLFFKNHSVFWFNQKKTFQ